jgi:cystathionine beta-synthase
MIVGRELAASEGGHEAVVVVLLPDGGRNYLSKLYNDEWMRVNGLLASGGGSAHIGALLTDRHHDADRPGLVLARTTERVGAAIDRLQAYGISQMPVSEAAADAPGGVRIESIVGSISERGLLDRAFRDPSVVERTVGELMDPPLPVIDVGASLDDAFGLLAGTTSALVAVEAGQPAGIVTKLDLLEYVAHRPVRV